MSKRRLVIVGNGMATCRLLDELVARGATARYDVTVFGEEPSATYNRILLSRVLGGEAPDEIVTKNAAWFEQRGIRLVTGLAVRRLDTTRKLVETADGAAHRYDTVVLATGSQPLVPAIEGATVAGGALRRGVFVYRTMADCLAMREHARPGSSAIVLGGGLLGLEAAKVLSDAGLHVTVVHASETLMNAQLDPMAGEMLARQVEGFGIFVKVGRTIERVHGQGPDNDVSVDASADSGPIESVTLDDGRRLPADMLVLACGVRPRVDVARASGLPINKGVVVNDTLATEVPGVYAIGECAEHRGRLYGIVAPAWEQAAVLAAVLTGDGPQARRRYTGSKLYVRLKVAGVDVATMGTLDPELETDDVLEVVEPRRCAYRKVIMRDGKLVGAMLVGNTAAAASLVQMFDRGDPMPADPLEALCPAMVAAPAAAGERLVCTCNKVTEAGVREAIAAGCSSIEAVGAATRAGTGCGSCKNDLARLVTRHAVARPPLAAVG
ncbi:MAG TPA: FAD-dependent oxidoreductase [Polyangia bacterium]|nr:FAD-dependent oxidoreductase [Polyangia bacterium]